MKEIEENRKKIVFKIPEFPHFSETFLVAQILTAIKLGYDVRIITRKIITNNIHLVEDYQLLNKIIIDDYKVPKNKFVRVLKWCLLFVFYLKQFRYIYGYFKQHEKFSLTWLYQWVFYYQFDEATIFHIQYGTYKYPVDLLKKTGFFKPKVIVTFHGHDAFFPLYGYIENNGYYDNLFHYADIVTANTPYLRNQLLRLGCQKNKIELVPVGVDTERFFRKNEKYAIGNTLKLITVGRLNIVKGQIYALEVLKKLIVSGHRVEFKIIGDGPEKGALQNYIDQNNLSANVKLMGSRTSKEIITLLRESHLFLFTSVSKYQGKSTETQGLATLEAMSCGLPVIGFDSGGIKYTFEDSVSGFLCNEYDVNCVFNKVKYLIENPKILEKMGVEAIKFVNKNYSQKIVDEKWKYIYEKAL
ncbi:glycosyltransferase [Tamlana sp. 2_MG-2023]|uniref:glycosyltransferase n=1 Tax=unclassified Tamlana TaxID=2614803 RepID=UPI0026E16410|nr:MULTISPECIES: glycosyltransferase [unclassified Tamlana]MDO6758746.1 glycosyltransferase [Tamlana sp. 2_MG-2023]MDO6789445.1 glycosyltransferase [Tamlana sp. 1_MG-2023]